MPCPPLSYSTLSALSTTYAPTKPIYVLNLWKYRDNASYLPEHANIAGEPCTGREALQRYITAFRPLIPSGAAIHFKSLPVAVISGAEGEEWDFVAINKYPTLESFMKIVESKEYREGVRDIGWQDWRSVNWLYLISWSREFCNRRFDSVWRKTFGRCFNSALVALGV